MQDTVSALMKNRALSANQIVLVFNENFRKLKFETFLAILVHSVIALTPLFTRSTFYTQAFHCIQTETTEN